MTVLQWPSSTFRRTRVSRLLGIVNSMFLPLGSPLPRDAGRIRIQAGTAPGQVLGVSLPRL